MSRTKRFASLATLALTAGLILPAPAGGAAAADSACWRHSRPERGFAKKVNRARTNVEAGKLRLDPELSKVARKHTLEMVNDGSLFHQTAAQFRRRVTNWNLIGENVGLGARVKSLHKAFMASPLHKANIVNPAFRYMGVGVKKIGDRMWVTVVFEARTNPGTTLRMPDC